jgi:hypothetical protein
MTVTGYKAALRSAYGPHIGALGAAKRLKTARGIQEIRPDLCRVPAAPYLKYFSTGNLARTSLGTSSREANTRRIGRVASMIILAVMMSSVCERDEADFTPSEAESGLPAYASRW